MFKTRVCDIFGIQYPIIQAPMNWITCAELVAAVSNAGGLGVFGPNAGADRPTPDPKVVAERLRSQIRKARSLTDKPFAVNLSAAVQPRAVSDDQFRQSPAQAMFGEAYIQTAIEERVPVAYTSVGSPEVITKRLHESGMKVMHIVAAVRHAKRAEAAGVDAIIVGGYEAGGHSVGHDEIPLLTLLPQVVDAVKIPVIAGCGIADARGLVAAFALGAEGICMGSAFMAVRESPLHPKMKQAVIDANDTATVAWGQKVGLGRTFRNEFVKKYLEMEMSGATTEELVAFRSAYRDPSGVGFGRIPGALVVGDLEWGETYAGAIVGLIKEIKGAGDVVKDIVAGVDKVFARLKANPIPPARS